MDENYARHARRCGLDLAEPDAFTVARRKRGDGFRFVDMASGRSPGRRVSERLTGLVIPPAWRDVRCSAKERDHVLVVGTDAEGRRQYIYHPDWECVRNAVKAERLLRFGRALPRLRKRIGNDLRTMARPAQGRQRPPALRQVAAVAARLVDRAAMRPGNEAYAANGHRGVSTLTPDDVRVGGDKLQLDYVGKSGREHRFAVRDRAAARAVRRLKQRSAKRPRGRSAPSRPGGAQASRQRLFIYHDDGGQARRLTAAKLNRYLVEAAGDSISAKDFRTFVGSSHALGLLREALAAGTRGKDRERVVAATVKAVSERLRNTPAVARSSYILPSIIEDFEKGKLPDSLFRGRCRTGLDRNETALMRHLEIIAKR